jgi:hypothetical protein
VAKRQDRRDGWRAGGVCAGYYPGKTTATDWEFKFLPGASACCVSPPCLCSETTVRPRVGRGVPTKRRSLNLPSGHSTSDRCVRIAVVYMLHVWLWERSAVLSFFVQQPHTFALPLRCHHLSVMSGKRVLQHCATVGRWNHRASADANSPRSFPLCLPQCSDPPRKFWRVSHVNVVRALTWLPQAQSRAWRSGEEMRQRVALRCPSRVDRWNARIHTSLVAGYSCKYIRVLKSNLKPRQTVDTNTALRWHL